MNDIDNIIESIKSIFDMSEGKISSLGAMLNKIEINNIYTKFKLPIVNNEFESELLSKINILNALLEIVLENPKLEKIGIDERKQILSNLYKTISILYEQLLNQDNCCFNNLSYIVMYSMVSYLADRQTISGILIEKYINQKLNLENRFSNNIIEKLEFNVYYIIILMMSNIKNNSGLIILDSNLKKVQSLLNEAQDNELSKDEMSILNGIKISAYANIIYLTNILKEYLFTGNIIDENQNIQSIIDTYSYNAFYLLESEEIELKLIVHLIKYAYERIAENSIWNIAEKSPKIRKFIEKNLSGNGRYIYSLLPSQRDCVADVLVPKKSIIVSMPTSAGKSLLAELQILFSLHNYKTDDYKPTVCYVVPTNALIDQVKHDLKKDFEGLDFNIETVLPYYDIDEIEDEILTYRHIDILISTPEKLESLIRKEHKSIKNTRLLIMDEAHNLRDKSRGSKFELLLATVKQKMKEVNFMLLSPFISNADEIGEWLDDSKRNSSVVSMEWTPTRQYIGCNLVNKKKTNSVLQFYKSARNHLGTENIELQLRSNLIDVRNKLGFKKVDHNVRLCVILNDLIEQDGNILILCKGPGTAEKSAKTLTKFLVDSGKLFDLSSNTEISKVLEIIKLESFEDDDLLYCLKYGVCYHHSGISALVKEKLEELIRENYVKLVFSTTTLAQGMNFPINTVIFDTIKFHPKGEKAVYLTNPEFWNIAGRAGRAYKDKDGYVIISFQNSEENTIMKTKQYIKNDLENIVSSLNIFFKDDVQLKLEFDFLREANNAPILNLLQYINHILNISYDYDISPTEVSKLRTILNNSFLYHSLNKEEGFIQAQRKLNSFVTKYVEHINIKKKDDLKNADKLGISDISYSKIKSEVGAFISNLKNEGDNDYKVSEIILKSKKLNRLIEIINIISRIPEINISMQNQGKFDSESVAKILLGWVNGKSIKNIANEIKRDNQSMQDAIELCNRYLNSQMKSYMPWGISIYQEMSYDLDSDNAKMLPSYIYYGVPIKEAVIIAKTGVPRFAVKNVLKILREQYPMLDISVENLDNIKKVIRQIDPNKYSVRNTPGSIIKEIVDNRIE